MTDEDEIAALKRELAEIKQSLPSPSTEKEVAQHRDQVHQARERHMSRAAYFSPADLRAMEAASPTSVVKDIVARGAIPGPTTVGKTEVSAAGRPVVGGGRGWAREVPLRNGLGQGK